MTFLKNKTIYAIEPDINEANRLISTGEYDKVFSDAIYNCKGEKQINMTAVPGCSSILEPNIDLLEDYSLMITDWFKPEKNFYVQICLISCLF